MYSYLFSGFIPTFGPAFVHLYGSTRDYSLIDEHSNLNAGLGEGVSYRGRLLIALKTDISESIDTAPSEVEVEPTQTIHEVSVSTFFAKKGFGVFALFNNKVLNSLYPVITDILLEMSFCHHANGLSICFQ